MAYDPNYKMKFRPTSPRRLAKHEHPLPMVGDPPGCWTDWDKRCRAVYDHMMAVKLGIVPRDKRKGLWLYAETLCE